MSKIYLQMYSFAEFDPAKTKEQLESAAEMGYSGVELFGPNFATDAETMKNYLQTYGLEAISMHTNTGSVIDMIPYAKALSMNFIGIGMEYLPDEAAVLEYAKTLNDIGHQCRTQGLTLTYHNHTQEFKQYGDKNVLEILLENTDPENLSLEVDAGWVAAAGASPIEFVEKYGDRVKLIHIKESSEVIGVQPQMNPNREVDENGVPIFSEEEKARMRKSDEINCPAGQGLVDWKALKALADSKGCQAYIVEREHSYAGTRKECLKADIDYYKTVI